MMLTTPAASQKQAFLLAGTLNRLSLSESDTNPVISGQLQKILQVTFGYLQTVSAISVLFKGGNSNAQNLNYETFVGTSKSNLHQSPEFNGDCYSAKYSAQQTPLKNGNSPSLPVRRKLWIKLNCAETEKLANSLILAQSCRAGSGVIRLLEIEESTFAIGGSWTNSLILSRNAQSVCWKTKGEQYSGSAEHDCYSGSVVIRNGCNNENQQVITCSQLSPLVGVKLNQQITGKEKGSAENTTLWGYGFFHHELNQHLAARQDLQLVKNYLQNPHMLNDNANLRNYKNQHLAEQYARTYETFVGHRVTVSKPVQPFGSTSRCLSSFLIMRFIQAEIDSSPSFCIASRIVCASSGSTRKAICLLPLGKFVFDTCHTLDISCLCQAMYIISQAYVKQRSPEVLPTPAEPLTTNDRLDIEAAMLNHTPTRFKFLFLAVHRSDLNAKPHRESVTAHSEQDARRSLAGQFVLFFAGRLPEVSHA